MSDQLTHTQFNFSEVPDGDDVIAKCLECDYEIMHVHETGRVKILNFGDPQRAHQVTYVPPDGVQLSVGVVLDTKKPAGGPVQLIRKVDPSAPAKSCDHDTCKGPT